MKNIAYSKRKFLNPEPEYTAFIAAVVPTVNVSKKGYVTSLYPTLCIKDCERQVSLEFNVYNVQEAKRIKKKAQTFQTIINEFVDNLVEQIDKYTELKTVEPKNAFEDV